MGMRTELVRRVSIRTQKQRRMGQLVGGDRIRPDTRRLRNDGSSISNVCKCAGRTNLDDGNILLHDDYDDDDHLQCDEMARLFFNTWPFTTMKIGPITIF